MATSRLNRIKLYCECCGKQFIAVERSNKKLQRYCSGVMVLTWSIGFAGGLTEKAQPKVAR